MRKKASRAIGPALVDEVAALRRPVARHLPPELLARTVTPATVRSLDAIHLGTALRFRPSLTSFVTYDKRLLDAAQAAGLPIDSPA